MSIPDLASVLDTAHRALRGIDAADQTRPIEGKDLDAVSDAVSNLETYARQCGIKLSEFGA